MTSKHIILEKPQINEKFTVIDKVNGCLILPCWFVQDSLTHRNFLVRGKVVEGFSSFEKDAYILVNIDKSELGEGEDVVVITINDDGNPNVINDVRIPVSREGSFEFKITLTLKNNVDLSEVHRIRLKYNARAEYTKFIYKKIKTEYELENEEIFDLFISKTLKNTWIGLDPGTSGSCVCVGRGGAINNPTIRQLGDAIIPSTIIIPQSTIKKESLSDYEPNADYLYGKTARQQWKAEVSNGSRGFISIKKLLGYNQNEKIPVQMQGNIAYFGGAEIAHLLIKGIEKDVTQSIEDFSDIEKRTYFPGGEDNYQRLVVAIPNNYTLPKILDMVQSIQWLNKYKEVRYIYEPEAIVFNYLMKEFSSVSKKDNELVIVFDMGGATINVSVYRISVDCKTDGSDTVMVKTIGKVGYAVGGDNIDFALLETLLELYVDARNKTLSDDIKNKFEADYKDELLPRIFELKLAIIDACKNGKYNHIFSTSGTFVQFVNQCFDGLQEYGFKPIDEDLLKIYFGLDSSNIWEDYREKVIDYFLSSKLMHYYVLDRVAEAVGDVLSFCEDINMDRLIFSGRSVLYPGIKEKVKEVLAINNDKEWKGMDDSEIKSAVAKGACWYGMYSTSITLDNELITSSYGYAMTVNGEYTFCPVIKSKSIFDKYGKYEQETKLCSGFNNDANFIKFYQIMGAIPGGKFDESKKYKRCYIGDVHAYTNTKFIKMSIDRGDNISYKVEFEDGSDYLSKLKTSQNRDITDENDRAYFFATLPPKTRNSKKTVILNNLDSQVRIESPTLIEEVDMDENLTHSTGKVNESYTLGKRTRV